MTTPALIGYHNVLAEETISASTEESGFEKENAYDGFVFDYWKPTAVPAWLKATGKMPVGMWLGDTTEETLTAGSPQVTDPDLTPNANDLIVFGSITKTSVGDSGLVAYSGFSAANYLEQPYSSLLDFGTGDWAFAGWFENESVTATNVLMERGYFSGGWLGGGQLSLSVAISGLVTLQISDDNFATSDTLAAPNPLDDGDWHQYFIVRSGGSVYIYIDGGFVYSEVLVNAVGSFNNASGTLMIGRGHSGNTSAETEHSLNRALDYAPTAAEILAIYNKEKHYFKTGGTLPTTLLSTSATTADYFAMYAHDFAGSGSSVVLQYSDDDSAWTDAFDPIYLATSAPIFKTFTQSSHKYWRVYVDGAVQQIGIAMFGVALEMQRGLGAGFEPMSLGSENTPITAESSDGSFLGRSTKKRPVKVRLVFKNLTPAWVREYWPELLENLESEPFMALPSPDTYPDEAAFCWTDGPVKTPRYNGSNLIDLSVPLKARIK